MEKNFFVNCGMERIGENRELRLFRSSRGEGTRLGGVPRLAPRRREECSKWRCNSASARSVRGEAPRTARSCVRKGKGEVGDDRRSAVNAANFRARDNIAESKPLGADLGYRVAFRHPDRDVLPSKTTPRGNPPSDKPSHRASAAPELHNIIGAGICDPHVHAIEGKVDRRVTDAAVSSITPVFGSILLTVSAASVTEILLRQKADPQAI